MGDWVLGWSDFEEKRLGTRQAVQSLKTILFRIFSLAIVL